MDSELEAMSVIADALRALDGEPRRRVLTWVQSRYDDKSRPKEPLSARYGAATGQVRDYWLNSGGRVMSGTDVGRATGVAADTARVATTRLFQSGVLERVSRGAYRLAEHAPCAADTENQSGTSGGTLRGEDGRRKR